MAEDANLALVQRIFERWSAADYRDVDWADPEIEFVTEGPTDHGVHHGVEAMAVAFRRWLDAFEDFAVQPTDFETRGDVVLVAVRFSGRGKASGMPLDSLRGAIVFVVRDGRVLRLELHIDVHLARRRADELS